MLGRNKRYPFNKFFRTPAGNGLVFSAEDFENRNQPGGQGGGENGGGSQNQNPNNQQTASEDQPGVGDDIEIEVVDDKGEVQGVIPAKGKQPAQQQQQQQQAPNVLEQVLDGDNVPANLRGKRVSDVIAAMNSVERILAQNQQNRNQPQTQPHQPQPEAIKFTEDDFGVTADPEKFQQKLTQFVQQFAQQYVGPLQTNNLIIQSQLVAQNAKASLPYYDLFKDEIENVMYNQPVNITANPQSWQSVHDRFVRENIQKVVQHETSKVMSKPAPGSSERGNSVNAQPSTSNTQRAKLTPEEMRVIAATGVDPKEYVYYRDRY